ncbi:MAG: hypothetical protein EOO71_22605 [Myxococcaceae bacterium]|nr:MAG: hypothetical protein EOO71_22605 [Myxococcaceae bacterium]
MGGVISGATVRVRPNVQQNPTPGVTARAPTTPTTTPTPPPSKAPRDTFDTPGSGPTTRKVVPPKPQVEAGVDDDDAIVVKSTAPSPEHAQADELFAVSNDERLVAAVRTRASQPGRIIDARTPPRLQRAYLEFLQARKLKDSEPNQREFAQLLDARRAYASRNGLGAMNADQERQFLAETALARLSVRALAGQKVTLGDGERWMISALSDSKVALSPSDAKLLERCNWTNQGLSYSLAEERGKNQLREAQRASEFRSTPGRPYKAVLNVEDVFQGDAQVNAFTLAAQAGGYSGEEIRLAIDQLKLENVTLFCRRDKDGETLITEKSQAASLEERGGQEFITYSVDSRGALALRDARVALAGGFGSVKAYRDDFQNTPATWVSNLVSEWVKNEQQWDLTQGKSQDPILGPLMRGKYDAMREIGQVATNLTQLGEMMAQEGKQFLQTGNLLTTLNDNPEVVRYFDAESERFGNTFDALAKTYAEKEDTVMGQVARGFVGSIPKVAVSAALGPSGALLYTGAKDFHSAPNELARDLTLELLSIVTGPLVGAGSQALEGTISRTAPKLVDTALKQFVVQEVTDRGFSAVAGATQELLTTVGPAGMQRLLSKNGQPLSEADERKVSEQLTDFAYRRALWTGMLTGLILPSRPSRDADTAVLNTKDSALEGPLYRTEGNAQQSKLYASVKVPEANGKQRVEFIEVSPDNPRVKAALKEKPAQLVPQVDADTKLAISRYTNRLDDAGRKDLAAKANQYAAAKVRLDAETGVRRDAHEVLRNQEHQGRQHEVLRNQEHQGRQHEVLRNQEHQGRQPEVLWHQEHQGRQPEALRAGGDIEAGPPASDGERRGPGRRQGVHRGPHAGVSGAALHPFGAGPGEPLQ